MPRLPSTGRGPSGVPIPGATADALAAGSWSSAQSLERMPRYLQPVSADPRELQPDYGGQPQPDSRPPPQGDHNIPVEVLGGGLGVLRAVLGREAFAGFLRQLAFYSLGPANAAGAVAWGAGWVLDPLRWLYQSGIGLIVPGRPVRPVEGLLTPAATDVLAAIVSIFNPDAIDTRNRLKRTRIIADLERLMNEGRIRPDDWRLLETERRLGFRVPRPGERQSEERDRRLLAVAIYLAYLAPQLFGASSDPTLPPVPRGSVDP